MRYPRVYTPTEIKRWDVDAFDPKRPGKGYFPARPLQYIRWGGMSRLKLTWMVFTGKFDALNWEE